MEWNGRWPCMASRFLCKAILSGNNSRISTNCPDRMWWTSFGPMGSISGERMSPFEAGMWPNKWWEGPSTLVGGVIHGTVCGHVNVVVVGGRASPNDHDGKVEAARDDRVEVASEGKTVSGGARDPATCTECRLPGVAYSQGSLRQQCGKYNNNGNTHSKPSTTKESTVQGKKLID